ncbi:hypothetical protein [[Erwinia] mediterraneensis]|nr:hypothetical protein [[Erwinia] mediterraneensis]
MLSVKTLVQSILLIGFGQRFAMPVLMRMITGCVAPDYAGMIAGVL